MSDLFDDTGHECVALEGAKQTIDDIAGTHPDLLIVDLRLASEVLNDGWAVVVGARAHPGLKDVPIVVCSADVVFLRERAGEVAALADVHTLEKPFRLEEVEELVNRLLARS